MATQIRLDYEAASAQARVVESLADEIRTLLNELVDDISSSVNNASVWTGDSADKFKIKWDECAESFDSYVNHIKTIQSKIDAAATTISEFDNN